MEIVKVVVLYITFINIVYIITQIPLPLKNFLTFPLVYISLIFSSTYILTQDLSTSFVLMLFLIVISYLGNFDNQKITKMK